MVDFDRYMNKYVEVVDNLLGIIPYERTKTWKDFFFNPTTVIAQSNDSLGQRAKDIYVMSAIALIIALVSSLPGLALAGVSSVANPFMALGIGIVAAIYVVVFILSPLFYIIWAALEYLVAKILGGKADFTRHFSASVLPDLATFVIALPLTLVLVPFEWLQIVPIASLCVGLLSLPLSIGLILINFYGLYLKYKAFKEVHKLTMWRSIGVVFLPVFVLIAIVVVIAIMFYTLIVASLLGSGVAAGGLLG